MTRAHARSATESGAPLVSIVIPTFNRQHFVLDAIESGFNQSYANCEVIVVDDGSQDGTADFLRETYGDRIVLVTQANQGPGIARNSGIAVASGEFIHFLDADDRLHPQKIEIGLDIFRRRPEVAVVFSHFQFVAHDGETPVETPPFDQYTDDVFCELLRQTGCRILTSSSMIRAEALRAIGGFADDVDFRSAEDWDLFLRLARRYRFHGIDRPLVYRRMHDSMISDDRLHGALGRLKTMRNARQYGWETCMTPLEFERKLAARHHVYALYLWQAGQAKAARGHFLQAAALCPPEAKQRRLFALYTWLLPPEAVDWTLALAQRLRRLMRGAAAEASKT